MDQLVELLPHAPSLFAVIFIVVLFLRELRKRDDTLREIVQEFKTERLETDKRVEAAIKECTRSIILNTEELKDSKRDRERDRVEHVRTLEALGACSENLRRSTEILDRVEKKTSGFHKSI